MTACLPGRAGPSAPGALPPETFLQKFEKKSKIHVHLLAKIAILIVSTQTTAGDRAVTAVLREGLETPRGRWSRRARASRPHQARTNQEEAPWTRGTIGGC